jgi:hypothetical protein
MPWGYVAAAVVTYATSENAADAAGDAADTQAESADEGIREHRRQYDLTRQDLLPWQTAGAGALGQQQALLGLSGQEAQQAAYDQFRQDPGQAFLQARGQRNLLANSSAIGGLGGGNVRSALVEQGVGFGQQDFGNYYNRLAGLSGTGQQTAAQLGQFGQQSAGSISDLLGQAGNARASGILGQQQARSQGWQNFAGLVSAGYNN